MSSDNTPALDGNSIVAEVITDLTRDYIDRARNSIGNAIKKNILIRLETFESYVQRTHSRCSTVRVILDKDKIYDLSDIYVEGRYARGDEALTDTDIASSLRDGGKIVVQGFGGIGKTILLKHLWMTFFENPEGVIPIFIELKRLNDLSAVRLDSYIRATLTDGDPNFLEEFFDILANSGRFVFLFDAFDEVNDEKRDEVEREILKVAYKFPKAGIVVSTRKDNRFYSWEQFSVCHAAPFNQGQIEAVVRKVEFDPVVKKKFLEKVIEESYDEFSDFLSTPLLALMMLLMYRQFADVPEKIHIFYRYAFQTLYSLHDAGKESFNRQRKTKLNEDDFAKIFSLVSLMSYISMTNTFEIRGLRMLVNSAKTRASIEVDTDAFIQEAIESVNLLYQEGDMISFVHRSFQEYFAAFAIVNFFGNKIAEVFRKLPARVDDGVLMMSYEMNRDVLEENYIIPQYKSHKSFFDKVLSWKEVGERQLIDTRARWIFFIAPGRKVSILQENIYTNAEEMKFCLQVGMSVSRDYYRNYEWDGADILDEQSKAKVARKFVSFLPEEVRRRRSSVLIIVDFASREITYDELDGTRAALNDQQYDEALKVMLDCKKYFMARLTGWKKSISFLRGTMRSIFEREQSRSKALDVLNDL